MTKRIFRFQRTWYLAVIFMLGVALYWWIGPLSKASQAEQALRRFFPSNSIPVEGLIHGHDRSIFGDGSYVVSFTISAPLLQELMNANGYRSVPMDSDPIKWRAELCNSVIARLTKTNINVGVSSQCYSRDTSTNRARVYFDSRHERAVAIGFGVFSE